MKNIAKSLVVAGAMAVAGGVNADVMADLSPYVGVDYQQSWMGGKDKKASGAEFNNLLPKSYPGANLYVGSKVSENFGLELGVDWTARKKRTHTFADGRKEVAKSRHHGAHLDVVGFMPVADCTELFASLGLGWVKPKVTGQAIAANGTVTDQSSLTAKAKMVARVGVGASYMVTEMVGLRAKLGYEGTSRLRMKDAAGITYKAFKNSATAALGAFVKF